ncbi:hypothetical protein J2755_000284 [Methanohalophilus levihalophilus]|uniref:zonular occludens toxin domain-containing protein n=1 Tax=Methanohalophilus levihalophilus TaxID=1431282 RepID=UPI001AE3B2B1|nr:zonular occludens toxin domain-containing protein [Methanohalophilus levihalophilus]MBP2029364.1 hypothetical protein [Methanohalophilus levihalophilus]
MTSSCDVVTNFIRDRINNMDKNFMGVVVGETGSGKSATAVEIARKVDPTFEANPRIVFTPKEFMDLIPKMKKGQAIIFDEAGVGIPAREWMRVQNKLIGYVAQLFRHLNLCVIFTVPSMSFIDKQVKNLMHAVIETKTIDYEHNLGVCKYWKIRHNAVFDMTKLEPFVLFDNGNHYNVDPLYVPFPPLDLWDKYVSMKEIYANKFYQDTQKELSGIKDHADGNRLRKLTNQSNCLIKVLPLVKEHFQWGELETITGVSQRQMRDWMKETAEAEVNI